MSHLRICMVIPGFGDGGAQKQCIFLLNELSKNSDVSITLIYFHAGVHDNLLIKDRIDLIHMSISSSYDPRNILKIRALLRKVKPDIMMTWLQSCDVLGFFSRRAVPGMRWLMTERDSDYPLDPRFVLRRLLGRHADAIVANSEMGRNYWRKARAKGEIYVVSNIVSPSKDIVPPPRRSNRVITIGRLEAQKNAVTVIGAFCELATRRPDLSFAVLGQGSLGESLQAMVRTAGMGERISFLGFRTDIDAQIADCALVVSMSHHEGLPNVMLESVVRNRLVVASDIKEHRELLGDDYPYLVVEREDPVQVAAMIEEAIAARDRIESLEFAKSRITTMSPSVVTATYLKIFNEMTCAAGNPLVHQR